MYFPTPRCALVYHLVTKLLNVYIWIENESEKNLLTLDVVDTRTGTYKLPYIYIDWLKVGNHPCNLSHGRDFLWTVPNMFTITWFIFFIDNDIWSTLLTIPSHFHFILDSESQQVIHYNQPHWQSSRYGWWQQPTCPWLSNMTRHVIHHIDLHWQSSPCIRRCNLLVTGQWTFPQLR